VRNEDLRNIETC